ncbi:MAG: 4Fe-4S dicluster domain-containing protein [Roseivirga sp.]
MGKSKPQNSFLAWLRSGHTLWQGLLLSWKRLCSTLRRRSKHVPITASTYFSTGAATLQYPHEALPVPDRGRYQLHNAIDDCIVCDLCAQVCPVDCITIEPIKSPVPLGTTSNGMTKRLHAARFDINMAQCCFCGLCTTVCPTACLTMTSTYDYSTEEIADHTVPFATLTPTEIAAHQQAWAAHRKASTP